MIVERRRVSVEAQSQKSGDDGEARGDLRQRSIAHRAGEKVHEAVEVILRGEIGAFAAGSRAVSMTVAMGL